MRHPIDLTECVVVGLEAKFLKPGCGPRAHVAQSVPAVDDHRPSTVKALGVLRVEFLERKVDRAGQVQFVVLLRRQDLHELRAARKQLVYASQIDRAGHH